MIVLLEILSLAILAVLTMRFVPPPWRGRVLNVLKFVVTLEAFRLLLTHPVTMEAGSKVVAGRLVMDTLANIDETRQAMSRLGIGAQSGARTAGMIHPL